MEGQLEVVNNIDNKSLIVLSGFGIEKDNYVATSTFEVIKTPAEITDLLEIYDIKTKNIKIGMPAVDEENFLLPQLKRGSIDHNKNSTIEKSANYHATPTIKKKSDIFIQQPFETPANTAQKHNLLQGIKKTETPAARYTEQDTDSLHKFAESKYNEKFGDKGGKQLMKDINIYKNKDLIKPNKLTQPDNFQKKTYNEAINKFGQSAVNKEIENPQKAK